MNRFVFALLGLVVLASTPVCLARNIILFIGDGMGFEHVQAGRLYVNGSGGGGLMFEALPYHGQAITTLPGGAVTDSATSGTALATGYQHPANGTISTDTNGYPVQTILEKARDLGWRTGIITTDDIGGATPGSFGAHEPDRNLMTEIRNDYLLNDTDHAASLPNVLFGGGASDAYSALGDFVGYTVVRNATELSQVDLSLLLQPRLLGQFATSTLTREHDRLPDNPEPRLSDMVRRSLELLSREPTGFFLIVEGALIDKLSHDNASSDLCPEVAQFDLAFQEAATWVLNNGGFGNTLLLVTADHETGGLNVPDDQSIQPGQVPSFTWSSTGHTALDVPVYASWPLTLNGTRIDNTETFFVMEDWSAGASGQPPVIADLAVQNVKQNSASVTWTTREPSVGQVDCYSGVTLVVSGSETARVTTHQFSLTGLEPDTDYQLQVSSADLAGFSGTAVIAFRTASPDVDAYVQAEPQVTLGSVVGSHAALSAAGDGQTQTITESPSGIGAALDATYTLHTTAPVNSILGVTLNAAFAWTDRDRGKDSVALSVSNVVNGGWDSVSVNAGGSFVLNPALAYVSAAGDLRLRFEDTALITREKKDVLTIDWLHADVVAGPPDTTAPVAPNGFSATPDGTDELTAVLTWDPNEETDLAGYRVWRSDWTPDHGVIFTTQTTYTDRAMSGGTYSYTMAAVDLSGNVSGCVAWVSVGLENKWAPAAPSNLQAQAGDREVLLTWDKNPEWDVNGYNVYLYDVSSEVWRLHDDGVVNNSYRHSGLVNGQTYTYRVTAIDSALESVPSGVVSATPSAVPRIWVESIAVTLQQTGKNWKATASLEVLTGDKPAVGATVVGDWYFNDQLLASGVTGTSDAAGALTLTSPPVKTSAGTFTFRVTNVALSGYAYEPAGHATEGSAAIP